MDKSLNEGIESRAKDFGVNPQDLGFDIFCWNKNVGCSVGISGLRQTVEVEDTGFRLLE